MSNIRKYYENKFREYPDVVDLMTFRQMMGGISDSFARLLIHEDGVQHIFIKPHYWIFKRSIIDYLLSEDYINRRLKVRV